MKLSFLKPSIPPRALICAALSAAFLAGCAQPARQLGKSEDTASAHWSGRMALQVEGQGRTQNQSFSAAFELEGRPQQGRLLVFNPLGSTIASLQWSTSRAVLQQGEHITTSDSLPALLEQLTGSDLPIAALFDWLQGKNTAAAGWQVDLSRIGEGRLRADRTSPPPPASLRIVLDSDS